VPTPGQPLPAPVTTPQYYEMGGTFVRADVTYLQQDFSVFQPVAQPNNWPDNQRYDYLVRTRPSQTADPKLKANDNKPAEYQQAVVFALRELTGVEGPQSVQDWKQALPHPDKLVKLQGGFRQAEGIAVDAAGTVYLSDPAANRIHTLDRAGQLATFLED